MNLICLRGYLAWEALVGALRGALVAVGTIVMVFAAVEGGRVATGHGAAKSGAVADAAEAALGEPLQHSAFPEAVQAEARRRALADYLGRRYRVAPEAVADLVAAAFAVGHATDVDPLLILAVISVESRFNPIAESEYGARGLMQVVPRFHLERLAHHGGEATLLEPHTNMLVGAQILDEYVRRTGSLEAGLQLYGGAAEDPDKGYAQRVLLEQRRLRQVLHSVPSRPGSLAFNQWRG
jgi:soluble lytic murein transglycosylase-like protein